MDANNRLNDLISITDRLAELLERENDALKNHRTEEVNNLLDQKATLSRVYEVRYKSLKESLDSLDEIDDELREQLRTLAVKVDGLMEENTMYLRAAIEANRQVAELIAEAVRNQQPNAGTYGSNATKSLDGANAAGRRIAFSVDQTL